MTAALRVAIESIGLIAPGLPDWTQASAVLRGQARWQDAPIAIPPPQRLPPAERRRVGVPVKLAMAVAEQAFAGSSAPAADTATVFASSSGDGDNCHQLSEALTAAEPIISPTRFTNSVHNVPAGYWSIAVGCRAMSTSVCAHDGSFCAGLLEAATLACVDRVPVALVAFEVPYPEPIRARRPIEAACGVAIVLWPADLPHTPRTTLATLSIGARRAPGPDGAPAVAPTTMTDAGLDALRRTTPAARSLPLLEWIARAEPGERGRLVLDAGHGFGLPIDAVR
ncbi:MAG: beta-ketoacyl synthase chain length factor [Burkholderiaceae bacterium]